MWKPTISIGIPVYNQADTIANAIEAALTQTIQPSEVVVCDNHSTDGTADIVAMYRERVRVVSPPSHLSMAENWNYCVRQCSSDWVGLCSGDDVLLPNYTTGIYSGIRYGKDVVFVMGGWMVEDLISRRRRPHLVYSIPRYTKPNDALNATLQGPKASFASFAFKRTAFELIGGYDTSFHLIQDWVFQGDIARCGGFANVRQVLAKYTLASRPDLDSRRQTLYVEDLVNFLKTRLGNLVYKNASPECVKAAKKHIWELCLRYIRENALNVSDEQLNFLGAVALELNREQEWLHWQNMKWVPSEKIPISRRLRPLADYVFSVNWAWKKALMFKRDACPGKRTI